MTDAAIPVHLVFGRAGYDACRLRSGADDPVIFLGDGVYLTASETALPEHALVLAEDLQLRGIDESALPAAVNVIDYAGMVRCLANHAPSISWR